jgi:peptide-methionine (S)-S-oxide reductase
MHSPAPSLRPRCKRSLFASLLLALALLAARPALSAEPQTAILAGGCFWCVEADLDKLPGVLETVSGYSGGDSVMPTYENHSAAGHLEVVKITFDPDVLSYRHLLDVFWRTVDVTDDGGQFCDRGNSYRTAVFVQGEEQRAIAEASKADAQAALGAPIKTRILEAAPFWRAEDYHQDYYEKSSLQYSYYRFACGRDRRVERVWGEAAFKGLPGH